MYRESELTEKLIFGTVRLFRGKFFQLFSRVLINVTANNDTCGLLQLPAETLMSNCYVKTKFFNVI